MAERISAWSHSRMVTFEQCKRRAKHAYIDKIPEPERPLPAGKTEHANDRGTRIHKAAELYVRGGVELLPELQSFATEFARLRQLYSKGLVSLEENWGFSEDWEPTAWMSDTVWLRMKLDAFVRPHPDRAVVIDYKTGKKYGNEVKHAEQGQLYQVASFMRYPELEYIDVEFWYPDKDDLTRISYRRKEGTKLLERFHSRGMAITKEEKFPANPNIFSCKWCPYGPRGTGHCERGV